MKKIEDVTIGADIELFIAEKATNTIVSAEPFILGTKEKPFNFDKASKYFATSLDNVLAEFCIPPATTKDEFYKNILHSMQYINETIPKEYCTVAIPAANLDIKYLMTEHAQIFGCEPDFNAYTGLENIKPRCNDITLRSAGGHLHFGYLNPDVNTNKRIIKAMDLFIGIPSIIQEPENKRKELYGCAGAYRNKKYGVEYRTISNYYLQSKKLTDWVFDSSQKAIDWLNTGGEMEPYMDEVIQNAINHNSKEMAESLILEFNLKIAI